ncbi:MAG: helix-turn-helix domain-containing protein [Rhodospirillales bacterium]|nr:helix-turn-helix domain-containing protein [Rhodospirillales bacterium]
MNASQSISDNHVSGGLLDGYLTPAQLAEQLGVSLRTLSRWHAQRIGPRRVTNGRLILYRADAVREWLDSSEGHAPKPEPRIREVRR